MNRLRHSQNSRRLKGFDYSTPWWYYITICSYKHEQIFGIVNREKVYLSPIGLIAERLWKEIPLHSRNIELDDYVIMPNHIHGIIIINEPDSQPGHQSSGVIDNATTKNYFSQISPKKNSLSVVLRTYKAAVTRECRKLELQEFRWQTSYYDRIIRNETELFAYKKIYSAKSIKMGNRKKYSRQS